MKMCAINNRLILKRASPVSLMCIVQVILVRATLSDGKVYHEKDVLKLRLVTNLHLVDGIKDFPGYILNNHLHLFVH